MAARRISGSPRSRRPPWASGRPSSHAPARRRSAAPSRAKSPCNRAPTGAPRATNEERLAGARHMESRDGKPVLRMDREAVRRAARGALSWKALHEVLRDKSRNLLFNHLGLGEDEKGLVIQPDCADLPYFLRAYFAFKMGLPFGYAKCTRGGGGKPPQCPAWWNIQKEEPPPAPPAQSVAYGGGGGGGLFGGMFEQPVVRASAKASAAAARARAGVWLLFADDRRQRRPFRLRANGGRRRRHRLLSRGAKTGDAAPRHRVRRSLWPRPGDLKAHRRRRATRRASSSPSMGSRTGRSRASASGAAISCSRRIPRSAAPASSASGRSSPARAAACAGSPTRRSPKIRSMPISRSISRSSASKTSTIAWMT